LIHNPRNYKRSSLEKKFEKLWNRTWKNIDLTAELSLVPNRKFRSDYLHEPTGITIEIHGGSYMAKSGHSHQGRLDDYEKQNLLLINGHPTFTLGTSQINQFWVNTIGKYLDANNQQKS